MNQKGTKYIFFGPRSCEFPFLLCAYITLINLHSVVDYNDTVIIFLDAVSPNDHTPLLKNLGSSVSANTQVAAFSITQCSPLIPSTTSLLKRPAPNGGPPSTLVRTKNKKIKMVDTETLTQSTTCLFGEDEGPGIFLSKNYHLFSVLSHKFMWMVNA